MVLQNEEIGGPLPRFVKESVPYLRRMEDACRHEGRRIEPSSFGPMRASFDWPETPPRTALSYSTPPVVICLDFVAVAPYKRYGGGRCSMPGKETYV